MYMKWPINKLIPQHQSVHLRMIPEQKYDNSYRISGLTTNDVIMVFY